MIAFLSLDQFYGRHGDGEPPHVVLDAGLVLDSNLQARFRGVRPGLTEREARSLLREDGQFETFQACRYLERQHAWLDKCLLYSSRIEPESPASAWIDLSGHPDPASVAASLLHQVWTCLGKPVKVGFAPSKWVAKLSSRLCDASALELGVSDFEPVADVASYLAQLPTQRLTPVPHEHRERLVFLGYRTIGEVAKTPLHLLVGQFGKGGILIHEAATGRYTDGVEARYPLEYIEDEQVFEGGTTDKFVLRGGVIETSADVSAELERRDRLASEIHLVIEVESGAREERRRKMTKPTSRQDALQTVLLYLLDQFTLREPVTHVRVFVPSLATASTKQRTMSDATAALEGRMHVQRAVDKMRSVYGENVIKQAGEIKPERREVVLNAWKRAKGWS